MVGKSLSANVEEQLRIKRLVRAYFQLDTWTVAEAVLLMQGLQPARGCKNVSEGGKDFRNPLADPGVGINRAQTMLDDWIDTYQEGTKEELTGATQVIPFDFMMWAADDYENVAKDRRPEWLDYFLSFCRPDSESGALTYIPDEYVDCTSSFLGEGQLDSGNAGGQGGRLCLFELKAEGVKESKGRPFIARNDVLSAIRRIKARNVESLGVDVVWGELCRMAEAGEAETIGAIKKEDKSELPYKGHTAGGMLTKRSVRENLKKLLDKKCRETGEDFRGQFCKKHATCKCMTPF